jgi:hypothetical protein
MSSQSPITDSPWLWFALFSSVGLATLLLTGGKFGDRQAQVERKGQAHEAVVAGIDVEEDATGRKTVKDAPNYSRPGNIKIRLAPLAITVGTVCLLSLAMLARERLFFKDKDETADGRG